MAKQTKSKREERETILISLIFPLSFNGTSVPYPWRCNRIKKDIVVEQP